MKSFLFLVGFILAGILAYKYVPPMAKVIEGDVTENVTASLMSHDLPADVQINVEGRDVSLSGTVSTQEERQDFVNIARQAKGVHSVEDNLLVDESLSVAGSTIESEEGFVSSDPFGEIVEDETIVFAPFDEEPLFDFSDEAEAEEIAEQPQGLTEEAAEKTEEIIGDIVQGAETVVEAAGETIEDGVAVVEDAFAPEVTEPSEPLEIVEVADEEGEKEVPAVIEPEEEPLEVAEELQKSSTECESEIASLVAGKKINFETGVAKIEKASLPLLDTIAKTMSGCADVALHIHGYTDNVGDPEMNKKLSHSRAKSVGLYLLKQGIRQRVKIFGHGVDQPIADNGTEEGRTANRRIEFTVTDLKDSIATDDSETVKTIKTLRSINTNKIIAE